MSVCVKTYKQTLNRRVLCISVNGCLPNNGKCNVGCWWYVYCASPYVHYAINSFLAFHIYCIFFQFSVFQTVYRIWTVCLKVGIAALFFSVYSLVYWHSSLWTQCHSLNWPCTALFILKKDMDSSSIEWIGEGKTKPKQAHHHYKPRLAGQGLGGGAYSNCQASNVGRLISVTGEWTSPLSSSVAGIDTKSIHSYWYNPLKPP
jgi:hypothetical protein